MLLTAGQASVVELNDLMGMPAMARFIKSGLNINALRTNTLLMKDDWTMLDQWVVEVSSTILNGVLDLQDAGLSFGNGGPGTMVSQYHQRSAMQAATVTMDPRVAAPRDRINYPLVSVPVPFVMSPFEFNIREISAARQHGHALDRDHVDDATRAVSEGLESLLYLGSSIVVQGNSIYGYMNHPDRNTTSGSDWGTSTNIYPNVLSMLGIMKGDGYTGPYRMYLHPDQYQQTLALNASTSVPILRTIEQIPGFGPGSVKEAGTVTAGQGVLVNMSRNCVDLSVGQDITVIEWSEQGGMVTQFVVMACMTPRVKSTADGKSGIVHISSI